MPIYEYRCSSCGHQQEFLQKVSDAPLTTCTACGKPDFSKMLTAAGFQLKGSGWYVTDYARKGNGSGGKKDDAGSGTSSEGKSEGGTSEGTKSDGGKADTKAEKKPSAGSGAKSTS